MATRPTQPVQAQPWKLAGSGASIGDTTLTLQAMLDITGATLAMASFGTKGYLTLEPGNGTQEEQVSFTGITQNSNGTATLTGVSTVGFIYPYTETSGIAKTHAGATTVVASNTAAFETAFYTYVDSVISGQFGNASATGYGLTRLSIDPATPGQPIALGQNDSRVPSTTSINYLNSVSNSAIPYVTATGTAAAFTATLASSVSTLASGTFLNFQVPITNSTGVTLNVNSLGAKAIKKNKSTAVDAGDLQTGQIASVVYDGANFQLLGPTMKSTSLVGLVTTAVTVASSTATTNLISVSIPANTLGTTGAVQVIAYFDNFSIDSNGGGGGATCQFDMLYGATAVSGTVTNSSTSVTSTLAQGTIMGTVYATGATNTQFLNMNVVANNQGTVNGTTAVVSGFGTSGNGTAAEDSTAAKNLIVRVTFNHSSSGSTITLRSAIVRIL